VLGHPSALPVGDEVYGVPPAWPPCLDVTASELAALRGQGAAVRDGFTAAYNEAMRALVPSATEVRDAFAAHGDVVLYNFPADLHHPARTPLLPEHVFLGSAVRSDQVPVEVNEWTENGDERPVVYASFGTFLSARTDVLAEVAVALRPLDVRVAMASGSTDPAALGEVPDHWLVRPYLPQVALLEHAAVTITHGGNNSVTESLAAGVPMLVLPFSTDQFAGAADIERAGVGRALAPNTASSAEIADAVSGLMTGPEREAAGDLGVRLRASPGPSLARAAMEASPIPG
jgi:zeaxanthin glucosyltransferase